MATIAFGNSLRNDKSIFISNGNHPGFLVKTSVKLAASSILFELFLPSTKTKLFNAFVILSESTGSLTVSHSSNSTTPIFMSETFDSIKRKSMSVNSKNDSSTLSFSDNFAIPDTSISLVLSKHSPNILCMINSIFCKSSKSALTSPFLIDIAPVNWFIKLAKKLVSSKSFIVVK